MKGGVRQVAVAVAAAAGLGLGCEDATSPLGDAGPADLGPVEVTYCEGFYWDLEPGATMANRVPEPCAVGAVCGVVTGFGVCGPDGQPFRGSDRLPPRTMKNLKERIADYPYCELDTDCGEFGEICLFQPGCETPRGVCCSFSGFCTRESIRFECGERNCLTYCGCDGETFEDVPDRPYRHPGACR